MSYFHLAPISLVFNWDYLPETKNRAFLISSRWNWRNNSNLGALLFRLQRKSPRWETFQLSQCHLNVSSAAEDAGTATGSSSTVPNTPQLRTSAAAEAAESLLSAAGEYSDIPGTSSVSGNGAQWQLWVRQCPTTSVQSNRGLQRKDSPYLNTFLCDDFILGHFLSRSHLE